MPDDSPPASGGIPTPGPGNLWYTARQKRRMEETLSAYRQSLQAWQVSGGRGGTGPSIPPYPASISGMMRDYLSHAVGLIRFSANVYGFEFSPSISILARDLRNLANGLTDYRQPLTRAIKQVMLPSIQANFTANGRPRWAPLDVDTVRFHRKKLGLGPTPILVRTGRLKHAATSFSIWSISQTTAVVRNLPPNVWYGALHQGGTGQGTPIWFKGYQDAARTMLGRTKPAGFRPKQKDIDKLAWHLFDEATGKGLAGRIAKKPAIPARRFIMYQEEDFAAIQQVFYEWMDEQIVKRGKFIPSFFPPSQGRY